MSGRERRLGEANLLRREASNRHHLGSDLGWPLLLVQNFP